jgi:two-component system, LytTR family, sensor kinase
MLQPVDVELAASYPRGAAKGFSLAWLLFCALLMAIRIQEYVAGGGRDIWEPVLWEIPLLLVSSAGAIVHWRYIHLLDKLLSRPWRWFGVTIASVPVVTVALVTLIFGVRYAMYHLLGRSCEHLLSPAAFINEILYCVTFNLLFLAVLFGIRSFMAMSTARVAAARSNALAQQAQLLQLTQQIQPHFLFNSLTAIVEAIHRDPALAERLLLELSRLLRAATDLARKPVSPLDDEIRLLEGYALIMEQRFADRASVRFEVDPAARACVVPTMLLQPLLENAFRHGVERHTGSCAVVVAVRHAGDRLELEVRDNAGTLASTPQYGVGLSNVQQRLAARYGLNAALSLRPRVGRGVVARIEMPCES